MPANRGQLTVLNSSEAAALTALSKLKVVEVVKVSWPAPTGTKWYSWWQFDDDPEYGTPIDWLGEGETITPAFVADNPAAQFHTLTETSAIGDDVVEFRFSNQDQEFETLAYTHREGVRVEVFYWFPELPKLVSRWFGHLRNPEPADADFITITAATGFRSNSLELPNRTHGIICGFHFGGTLTQEQFDRSLGCPYDLHLGGTEGLEDPDTSNPFTECDGTRADCIARFGHTDFWGGHDTVEETVPVGKGDHKTYSRSVGNESRLIEPKRVVYGERDVRELQALATRREFNPSEDHQDAGTFRAMLEVSEGPVQAITAVQAEERDINPLNYEVRLGTLGQTAVDFTPNVLNYSLTALVRVDLTRVDPATIKAQTLTSKVHVVGRNTIRVYSDEDTFVEQYTNLRAWCALDLLTDLRYGHRLDTARFLVDDFIYLAGLGSVFNCDVQGTRTAQQQFEDICAAGLWYLPFHHNGVVRFLPQEEVDLDEPDIPVFTDSGAFSGRNILWDRERATSRLQVEFDGDDVIVNEWTVAFDDGDHQYIERPLRFWDESQQRKAGELVGDNTLRPVRQSFAAYGLTSETDVKALGRSLLDVGPFGNGGINNNCRVVFYVPTLTADVLNLHVNKIIKVTSDKLDPYLDPDDEPFQYFRIRELVTEIEQDGDEVGLTTRVVAQAYRNAVADDCVPETGGSTEFDPDDLTSAGVYNNYPSTYPLTYMLWVQLTADVPITHPSFGGSFNTFPLAAIISNHGGGRFFLGVERQGAGNNKLVFGGEASQADARLDIGPELEIDTWYHLAVTGGAGDPGDRKIYVNGEQVIDTDGTDDFIFNMYVGNDNSLRPFPGRMTAFKVWDSQLTAEEVASEYEAACYEPQVATGNIYSWSSLNGTGDGDDDQTGNGRDITFSNVAPSDETPEELIWCEDPCGSGRIFTGGTEVTLDAAPSAAVIVDRIISDTELFEGRLGVYVGIGPTNDDDAWAAASLYVDRGGGYESIADTPNAATLGEATTILAGTELGSETVQVEIQPGQTLETYTVDEIAAGAGFYFLGGEVFQARTATQDDTDPNLWTLSNLSNRGARCTEDFQATHATGDDFLRLDEAVVFVPLPQSEIGETRDYKAVTAGEDVADAADFSFTFNAPNYVPTTPADYNADFDSTRNEIIHTWTPIADVCLVGNELQYEIRIDSGGSPGTLLWRGTASEWRETVSASATRAYHFRAVNEYGSGNYETDSVTFTVTPGAGGSAGIWEPVAAFNSNDDVYLSPEGDDGGQTEIVFADGDVVMAFVED